jgi:hypothetical protein
MVGEQEACVVSLRPVGAMALADGVNLSCIQMQPALEIASCQLQVRAIQSDDAHAESVRLK